MELNSLKIIFLKIFSIFIVFKTPCIFVVGEKQWPNGIIPFQFSETSGFEDRSAVHFASLQFMYLSCIKMVDMNLTRNAKLLSEIQHEGSISFEGGRKDCFAPVGFFNARRSARCCDAETCLHEIGHILGLEHEHKRSDRNYYIHLNFDNVESHSKSAMLSTQNIQGSGFDFRSVMLYRPTAFSTNGDFIYRILDSAQKYLLGQHNSLSYYDVKEVNSIYKCQEKECSTFRWKCLNDGFVLKLDDKCQCFCPQGLDPRRRCANIYRPAKPLTHWPEGSYALLMADRKCPGEEWIAVKRYHCLLGFVDNSRGLHLSSIPQSLTSRETICIMSDKTRKKKGNEVRNQRRRRLIQWESGSYCILKNGECPQGFQNGFIQIKEYNTTMVTSNIQKTIQNNCQELSITNEYCCRQDDSALKPIRLPSSFSFILLMSSVYESCQQVQDMQAYIEEVKYVNQNGYDIRTNGSYPFFYTWKYGFALKYCYYVPLKQECGSFVKLNRKQRSTLLTSPNFPKNYDDNLFCNWLIKGPKKSIIRLEFLEFLIDGNNQEVCTDYVEIRFNMIGQPGIRYCGELPVKVILSNSNLMMISLKSNYIKNQKGFQANVSFVRNSEFCYNVQDNGHSYRGTVNVTKDFEKCVYWNETTKCRHHAFNARDGIHGIGNHNFCRNPGHGLKPWCYTDFDKCTRKYCDACGIAGSYDLLSNCKEIILKTKTFCQLNESATRLCYSSCGFPFPQTFNNNTANMIHRIRCKAPMAINGDILYQKKKIYRVGEEVLVHCHGNNKWQQKTKCLSDGNWNQGRICGICPLHWVYNEGSCYRFFSDRVCYSEAEKICQELDSVVAAPSGLQEFQFMLSMATLESGIWLGLTFHNNKWKTSSGDSVQWTNWRPGQPDFKKGEEKCARFLTFDNNQWEDVPCDWYKQNAFLCKRSAFRTSQCFDFSDDCSDFVKNSPTFCEENRNFAIQFCSKTCRLCQIDSNNN